MLNPIMNRPFFRNMAFFHMKRYIFMSASSPQEKIVNYLLIVRNIFIKVLSLNGLVSLMISKHTFLKKISPSHEGPLRHFRNCTQVRSRMFS